MARQRVDIDTQVLVDLYVEGNTIAVIASKFGVSSTFVKNHLADAGATMRPRGRQKA